MAASPGFKWQARGRAYFEALERWALIGWWDGRLKASVTQAPYPNVGLVRIEHGQEKARWWFCFINQPPVMFLTAMPEE